MVMDDLLVVIFCVVDEAIKHLHLPPLRKRGPKPQLADSEVITMEIAGELDGVDRDKDIFRHFRRHHLKEFPALARIHRTSFVRQAANLWRVKALLQRQLAGLLLEAEPLLEPVAIIDSFPLPVCRFARAPVCRRLKGYAARGFDHTDNTVYYGLRVHLVCSDTGVILKLQVAGANVHDSDMVEELLSPGELAFGDRNYWDPDLQHHLKTVGKYLIAPFRRKSTDPSPQFSKIISRIRQVIEPVIGQLAVRLNAKRTWARDLWHLSSRLWRKALAHTTAMLINMRLGNPPLKLAALLG
jgi:hypothetical protein